jgi:hypothetical protein
MEIEVSKIVKFVNENLSCLCEEKREDIIKYFMGKTSGYSKLKRYFKYQETNFNMQSVMLAEQRMEFLKSPIKAMYDPEYVSYRNNISLESARLEIANFKDKKSTSKESFIKRHGEEVGLQKFTIFQKTSMSSSENMKKKLGSDEEWKKWCRSNSLRCPEYYLSRKLASSMREAKSMVSKHQLSSSGVHQEYYLRFGLSPEEISDLFKTINSKKGLHSRNRKLLKLKYGDEWQKVYDENHRRYRLRMEELKVWTPADLLSEFKKYHSLCWYYTRSTLSAEQVEDIEKRSIHWHLDHEFSVKAGFLNEVPPEIIGSVANLRIIPQSENSSKKQNCSITLLELMDRYENYKNNKG